MEKLVCDRCGRMMNSQWEIEGVEGVGGNCTSCGDNLCPICAGKWNEYGECSSCAKYGSMTLEYLEFTLPIEVIREERKEMPCQDCKRHLTERVCYEQRIIRFDDFFNNHHTRTYEIAYYRKYARGVLFRTDRHHSLKAALIEAHKILDQKGLKTEEDNSR